MTHVDDAVLVQMRDGTLAPRPLLEADDHLAGCERCRARFADIMSTDREFEAEVDAYARGRPRIMGRVVAGVAAALVVATGVWWLSRAARPESGAALMASVDAAHAMALHDSGRNLWLDANGQLQGGQGLSSRDSAWTVDALRGVPLRGPSGTESTAAGHLVKGALAEQAGDWSHATEEYRALSEENPASAFVAPLLARVAHHR